MYFPDSPIDPQTAKLQDSYEFLQHLGYTYNFDYCTTIYVHFQSTLKIVRSDGQNWSYRLQRTQIYPPIEKRRGHVTVFLGA